jgi:glycerophosphoryl diester phosphodiesterase
VRKPLIIGHRGAPDQAPENTGSAFRAAVETGVSIIETDVRITSDGHIVVAHDVDFSRLGGPSIPIRKCLRRELESIVLTDAAGRTDKPLFMDDALRFFPDVSFSVDLKDPGPAVVRAWSELIRETGAEQRCRTASFRDRTLRIFRRLNPGAPISVARLGVLRLLISTILGVPRKPGPGEGVLQVPERSGFLRILTPRRIALWQKFGWKVQVWTIDRENDMRRFIEWGIDGIITNQPSLLREVLEKTSF